MVVCAIHWVTTCLALLRSHVAVKTRGKQYVKFAKKSRERLWKRKKWFYNENCALSNFLFWDAVTREIDFTASVKTVTISSWLNFGHPMPSGKGAYSGAKNFGSALLQPAHSVCVSSERFFSFVNVSKFSCRQSVNYCWGTQHSLPSWYRLA